MYDGWDRLWVRGELRARREKDPSLGREWRVGYWGEKGEA